MRWYVQLFASVVLLGVLIGAGCATQGESATAGDDDFTSGPVLPPALAERPTPGDGASLYAAHCARCHTQRWPSERTDAEWTTILSHMRFTGNIPGEDAKAIRDYMRSSN